ncbi:hypothetical protein [Mammaliicoccus vitulinus]|uniref:hypothetical protein n=1 Tax=Mammaliicoccus vitulinus TaxID=71237 RepID=UPI00248C8B58|nr:hypothetical protein [Mammaliicoccus vitulinus]
MQRNILKRLHVDKKMNQKIKDVSKSKKLTNDDVIYQALEFYFSDTSNNDKLHEEDIYTQRINQLTKAVESLSQNVGSMDENISNRLDVLVEYNESPDYLKNL